MIDGKGKNRYEYFNIGTGRGRSVLELVSLFGRATRRACGTGTGRPPQAGRRHREDLGRYLVCRTESSAGRPSGRSRIRFVLRPGLGRNGCAESNRREEGAESAEKMPVLFSVCSCANALCCTDFPLRKRFCRRAVAVFGRVRDGHGFGKRKQGILDKLSPEGIAYAQEGGRG